MDPQDITKKTGPGLELQTEQLDTEQKNEPAHRCSICEGPNHHACGCEAKAKQENTRLKPDTGALPTIHYAIDGVALCSSVPTGVILEPGEMTTIEHGVTCPACRDLLKPKTGPGPYAEPAALEINQNINERLGALCDVAFDAIKFLQSIADDMITIRKALCEVKQESEKSEKADQPEIKQS